MAGQYSIGHVSMTFGLNHPCELPLPTLESLSVVGLHLASHLSAVQAARQRSRLGAQRQRKKGRPQPTTTTTTTNPTCSRCHRQVATSRTAWCGR